MSGVKDYRYGRIPEDLLLSGASDRACRLHALLTRWPYLHPGETPKRRELAAALHCSEDSVDRALWELEAGGWLTIHRHKDGGLHLPSEYELAESVRTGAEGGPRTGAATITSANDEMPGQSPRTRAATGPRTGAATNKNRRRTPEGKKSTPTAGAAAPERTPTTQTLMAEYVDACEQRPPGRVLGQLASETKRLFDEGISADHIRAGMAIVRDRGLHPAALASAVNQAMNPPRRNGHLRAVPAAPFATYDHSGPIPLD